MWNLIMPLRSTDFIIPSFEPWRLNISDQLFNGLKLALANLYQLSGCSSTCSFRSVSCYSSLKRYLMLPEVTRNWRHTFSAGPHFHSVTHQGILYLTVLFERLHKQFIPYSQLIIRVEVTLYCKRSLCIWVKP